MSDYIKREDALDAWYDNERFTDIEAIPSADVVERKRGMWQWRTIIDDSPPIGQYECSQCGYPEPRMEIANYCPRCGADMRGES